MKMKVIGIILVVGWFFGIIGEITYNDLPENIFEWMGNLAVLIVGLLLIFKSNKNKG